jgi:hypothetical protein
MRMFCPSDFSMVAGYFFNFVFFKRKSRGLAGSRLLDAIVWTMISVQRAILRRHAPLR